MQLDIEDTRANLDAERRYHPPLRFGRAAYEAACARLGERARDDETLLYGTRRMPLADPHRQRLRMLAAERDEARWRDETGFGEPAAEARVVAFPDAAPPRAAYVGLAPGATWTGPQAGRWQGRTFVAQSLPGHPSGWFVEAGGPIPLVVGLDETSATAMLRGRDPTGLERDVSLVSRVLVLLDPVRERFRVLTGLRIDDYIDSPLGHAGEGEDPAIEVIARYGHEETHPALPGEAFGDMLDRAVRSGREAVAAAAVEQRRLLANHARFAAFVESLPDDLDGPSYAASVEALGQRPHLDHELADPDRTRHWPSVGRSCGHADIHDDEASMRRAAARLLDEVRMRTVRAALDPAPAAPAP